MHVEWVCIQWNRGKMFNEYEMPSFNLDSTVNACAVIIWSYFSEFSFDTLSHSRVSIVWQNRVCQQSVYLKKSIYSINSRQVTIRLVRCFANGLATLFPMFNKFASQFFCPLFFFFFSSEFRSNRKFHNSQSPGIERTIFQTVTN